MAKATKQGESAPNAPDLLAAAQWLPIADLRPNPRNPRMHGSEVTALARTILRTAWGAPIVAQSRGRRIIGGHGRLEAAKLILRGVEVDGEMRGGAEHSFGGPPGCVPVRLVDVSDAEADAMTLADNARGLQGTDDSAAIVAMAASFGRESALMADMGYDPAALDRLVQSAGDAVMAAGGGNDEERHEIIGDDPQGEDPGADELPPDAPVVSRAGEVYELGPHRLVCGDSTAPGAWSLLGTSSARVVFTDPPFGVDYVAMRGGRKIANDGTPSDAERVTASALSRVKAEAWFVCCSWRSLPTMLDAMIGGSIEPKACIVWDKMRRVQNLDRFAKQHEFIIYAGPYGGQPTADVDVWQSARDFEPDHPTPKPPDLIARALKSSTAAGDVVVDMFGGSGSTLIACAQTGRVARLIELDPRYCDVIRRRWTKYARSAGIDPGPGALDPCPAP